MQSTSEWTLDYPPFFAWFEFLLAQVAVLFDARMLEVDNLEHASFHTILFQRLSVIATDAFLFFAIVYFIQSPSSSTSSSTSSSASSAQLSSSSPSSPSSPLQTAPSPSPKGYCLLLLAFANPGLLLVDHVHFQYNGMMIGLFLLSAALVLRGRDLAAGIAFAVLLNFKHIFLQSALVYFTYLLAHYCFVYPSPSSSSSSSSSSAASRPSPSFSVARLVTMGLCVVAVFCVSFLPFCLAGGGLEGMLQIFRRMFPFGERGLCHAYWGQ